MVRALMLRVAIGFALLAWPSAAAAQALWVSDSPTRAGPVPLAGASVEEEIFVFVVPPDNITRVEFFLDDPSSLSPPIQTERVIPFDFAGTARDGTAYPYDTTQLSNGWHQVTARISKRDGKETIAHADFEVINEDPLPYALQLSFSPTRTPADALSGQRVSGDVYIFVDSSPDISRVWFYLDQASPSPVPFQAEHIVPYDMAGTVPDGTAFPLDTSQLSTGEHLVGALVYLRDGSQIWLSGSFAVGPPSPPSGVSEIHLAWVQAPQDSITVVWRSDGEALVEYRRAGDIAWLTAEGLVRTDLGDGTYVFEATLQGLQPATAYKYRVAGDEAIYTTRTAARGGEGSLDVVFLGDTGVIGRPDGLATGTEPVIDLVAALDPHLVLLGGDLADVESDPRFANEQQGIHAWLNQVMPFSTRIPMMPTWGDNEASTADTLAAWQSRFPTSAQIGPDGVSFAQDIVGIKLISVFAPDGGPLTIAQLQWLEIQLLSALQTGQEWAVPYFHNAALGDGTNHPPSEVLRNQLAPLFETYNVKLVLFADDQAYERSYPLAADATRPTSTERYCYGPQNGVIWMKVSPGGLVSDVGATFSQFAHPTAPAWTAVRDNTRHHLTHLRFDEKSNLRVESWGVSGNGTQPVLLDVLEYRTRGECPVANADALQVSDRPDRSGSWLLQGTTLPDISYVFFDVTAGVKRVEWYVDDPSASGTPFQVERIVPYDLAGTAPGGSAYGFDATSLEEGRHTITAKVFLLDRPHVLITAAVWRGAAAPATQARVDVLLFSEIRTCFVGDVCTSTSCVGLRDDDQTLQVAFENNPSFRFLRPDDPEVGQAELVQCVALRLSEEEIDEVKRAAEQFRDDVTDWTNGSLKPQLNFHVIPPVDLTLDRWGGGPWLSPWSIDDVAAGYLSAATDFVITTAGIRDDAIGYHHDIGGCGGSFGANFGLAGAGYSWIPKTGDSFFFDCAIPRTYVHEWLHQLHWALNNLSGFDDLYNGDYPPCGEGSADPLAWFPDPHDCLIDPDCAACGTTSCESDPWNEHILSVHWDPDTNLIANHCTNGIRDYQETAVDSGGPCINDGQRRGR